MLRDVEVPVKQQLANGVKKDEDADEVKPETSKLLASHLSVHQRASLMKM